VPLIWFVMPFAAWGAATCLAMAFVRGIQGLNDSSRGKLIATGIWGVALIGFYWLYRLDPENHIEIVRGRIHLSLPAALAVMGFAIAAVGTMSAASRKVREIGGKVAVHAALLIGCVIFGMPFAWLLVTSFKEDRDMSNANGLVWIPRVQRTVPYSDPAEPLLEGDYKGNWVQATIIGKTSNGESIVEVQRPSSLRGVSFSAPFSRFRVVPRDAPVVAGKGFTGFVAKELDDGRRVVRLLTPASLAGKEQTYLASELEPVRDIGLRTQNYTEALEAMPTETRHGLLYLKNTLVLVVLSVIGTLLSSSLVAYGFARLRFPGRDLLFKILLSTMMLPATITLLPQFLLFRSFGWIDTLLPLWVPTFFAGAFNVFLLRQFFSQVPSELEDAAKIDGAGVLATFWRIMLPQIKPALAVVAIWTFMGAWNNFMGPLLYINTPENMPLSYALQLFQSERGGEPGLMMAFATLTVIPVVALFFFAQRYFIDGVTLSGLGGR
jgi:multiple sugar transport system permease protein